MQVPVLIFLICGIVIPVLCDGQDNSSVAQTNSSVAETNSSVAETSPVLPVAYVAKQRLREDEPNLEATNGDRRGTRRSRPATSTTELPNVDSAELENVNRRWRPRVRPTSESRVKATPRVSAPRISARQEDQRRPSTRDRIYVNEINRMLSRVLPSSEISVLKWANEALTDVIAEVLMLCGSVERGEIPPTPFVDCKSINEIQQAKCPVEHPTHRLPKLERIAIVKGPISSEEDEHPIARDSSEEADQPNADDPISDENENGWKK